MDATGIGAKVNFDGRQVTIRHRGLGTATVEVAQMLGVSMAQPRFLRFGRLVITAGGMMQTGLAAKYPLRVRFDKRQAGEVTALYRALLAELDAFRRHGAAQ